MDHGGCIKPTLIFLDKYPGRHIHMRSNPHKVKKVNCQSIQIIKLKILYGHVHTNCYKIPKGFRFCRLNMGGTSLHQVVPDTRIPLLSHKVKVKVNHNNAIEGI